MSFYPISQKLVCRLVCEDITEGFEPIGNEKYFQLNQEPIGSRCEWKNE